MPKLVAVILAALLLALPAAGTSGRSRRGLGLPMLILGFNLAPKSWSSGGCRRA